MPTDATLLSVGVESSGAEKGTQSLKGLEEQARKTEEAATSLGSSLEQASKSAEKAGQVTTAAGGGYKQLSLEATVTNEALEKLEETNDKWLLGLARHATAAQKTRAELIDLEAAGRGLTATQEAQLKQILEMINAQDRLAEAAKNDAWVQGLMRQAQMVEKTRSEIIELEAAERNLTDAQKQQVQQVVENVRQQEKYAEAVRAVRVANETAGEETKKTAGFFGALTETLKGSSIAAIATGAAIGTMVGNVILAAIDKLVQFVLGVVPAFARAEEAGLRVRTMLDIVGERAGITAEHVDELAQSMQSVTRFDSTDIEMASASMLKFGMTSAQEFDRAMKASAGLAVVMGSDIRSAAEMVGRAMENSYGSMMLRRMGLINDAQVEYLRLLKEVRGDEAYRAEMLKTIEQATGAAAQNVDGLGTAWQRLKNETTSTAEAIGGYITKHTLLTEALNKTAESMRILREFKWEDIFGIWLDRLEKFTGGFVKLGAALNSIAAWMREHGAGQGGVIPPALEGAGRAAMGDTSDQTSRMMERQRREYDEDQVSRMRKQVSESTLAQMRADREAATEKEQETKALQENKQAYEGLNKAIEEHKTHAERVADATRIFRALLSDTGDMADKARAMVDRLGEAKALQWFIDTNVKATKAVQEHDSALEKLMTLLSGDQFSDLKRYNEALQALAEAHASAAEKARLRQQIEEQLNPELVAQRREAEALAKITQELVSAYDQETQAIEKTAKQNEERARTLSLGKEGAHEFSISELEMAIATDKASLAIEEQNNAMSSTAWAGALRDRIKANEDLIQSEISLAKGEQQQGTERIRQQTQAMLEQAEAVGKSREQVAAYQASLANLRVDTTYAALDKARQAWIDMAQSTQNAVGIGTKAYDELRLASNNYDLALADSIAKTKYASAAYDSLAANLENQAQTTGKTREEVLRYNEVLLQNQINVLKAKEAEIALKNAQDERLPGLRELIASMEHAKEASGQLADAENAQKMESEWRRTADSIDRSLTDAFVNSFDRGKSLGESLRQALIDMFKNLVLRPIIQFVMAPISGMISGALQSLGLTGGSPFQQGGMSNMFNMGGGNGFNLFDPSSWSNIFTPPSWYNRLAMSGPGQWLGLSTPGSVGIGSIAASSFGGASMLPGFGGGTAALFGPEFGGASAMATEFAMGAPSLTAAGSFLGPLAAAAPLALMALPLLGGLFESEPSQVRGRFGVRPSGTSAETFEDRAYTQSKYGMLGFLDTDTQYFSGQAAQEFNKIIKSALDAFDARFSKEQSDHFATVLQGMVFDAFEGEYTTEDFLKKYGAGVTRRVVTAAFTELGDAALSAAMQGFKSEDVTEITNFVNSLLLIYDATKDLTEADRKLVEAMIGVTQESAALALAFADAFHTLEDLERRQNAPLSAAYQRGFTEVTNYGRDPITGAPYGTPPRPTKAPGGYSEPSMQEDVQRALAGSSPMQTFIDSARGLRDLTQGFEGTLEQTQALTAATNAYYAAEVQLVAQIEATKMAIGDMFSDTLRAIQMSQMSPQEQYNYYKAEADKLFKQMQTETDPAKVAQLAQKINADIQAAWGLLGPDEQRRQAGAFENYITSVNDFVQEHLGDIEETVTNAAKDMFKDVHDKLAGVATSLAESAKTIDTAANTQQSAANTQVDAANTQDRAANTQDRAAHNQLVAAAPVNTNEVGG